MNHDQLTSSPRRRRGLVIGALIVGAGTFLVSTPTSAADDAGAVVDAPATPAPQQTPPEPTPPTGLGTDPVFDALAQACYAGDLQSCDDLYLRTPYGSAYESYGSTCAGRVPEGTFGGCTTSAVAASADPASSVPPPTQQPTGLGSDVALDALAQQCYDGALFACDKLYVLSDVGSSYEAYGDTCGGRQGAGSGAFCHQLIGFPAPSFDTSRLPSELDPVTLDRALACRIGDMQGCDDLYRVAEVGSALEEFADTCAGRQAAGTTTLCASAFPSYTRLLATTTPVVPTATLGAPTSPNGLGTEAQFDLLAQACFTGDLLACDYLYWRSPIGSAYENYGTTCGGRTTDLIAGQCNGQVLSEPLATAVPAPTELPTGLGSDLAQNALAQQCYDGSMYACDRLYQISDPGSTYEAYADGCAGRQIGNTGSFCHELTGFPAPTMGLTGLPTDNPDLYSLAANCLIGDMRSCDDLYQQIDSASPFRELADTCGGRQATGTEQYCVTSFPSYEQLFETAATAPPPTGGTPTTTATPPPSGGVPAPTQPPTGLGSDPTLNGLAQRCYAGDLQACDDLFIQSPVGSAYETYGDTCAGRQDENGGFCTSL